MQFEMNSSNWSLQALWTPDSGALGILTWDVRTLLFTQMLLEMLQEMECWSVQNVTTKSNENQWNPLDLTKIECFESLELLESTSALHTFLTKPNKVKVSCGSHCVEVRSRMCLVESLYRKLYWRVLQWRLSIKKRLIGVITPIYKVDLSVLKL